MAQWRNDQLLLYIQRNERLYFWSDLIESIAVVTPHFYPHNLLLIVALLSFRW